MKEEINLDALKEFFSSYISPGELADSLADMAMNYIVTRDEGEDNMKQIKDDVSLLQLLVQQLRAL